MGLLVGGTEPARGLSACRAPGCVGYCSGVRGRWELENRRAKTCRRRSTTLLPGAWKHLRSPWLQGIADTGPPVLRPSFERDSRLALTLSLLPVVQARGAISGHALMRVPRFAPAAHSRPSGRSRARHGSPPATRISVFTQLRSRCYRGTSERCPSHEGLLIPPPAVCARCPAWEALCAAE